MTIEIGYALFSAAFAAAVVFGAVSGPALLFELPGTVARALLVSGVFLAALRFPLRVVTVLVRFGRQSATQPSHPGRTNPDS